MDAASRPSFFWYDNDKDLKVCFLVTRIKLTRPLLSMHLKWFSANYNSYDNGHSTCNTCISVYYRLSLCAIDLCFAYKSRSTMQFCTNVHFDDAQCSLAVIRWCTRFFMYFMSYSLDGAECDVVSLDVCRHSDF